MVDHGSPDTVEVGRDPRGGPRWAMAALVVVALVAGGYVAARHAAGDHGAAAAQAPSTPSADPRPGPRAPERPAAVVPWRDLDAGHPDFGRPRDGVRVTPFDHVTVTGTISGALHPGDTLAFDAVLKAPGLVSLRPCPDYTITVGTVVTSGQLNCEQVPYYASLVRPGGKVTSFRPVLPAGTEVGFRMRVTVPDQPGRQQVSWALEGPTSMPG